MENEEIILIKRVHSRNARTCHSSDLTRQSFFTPCNEGLIDSNGHWTIPGAVFFSTQNTEFISGEWDFLQKSVQIVYIFSMCKSFTTNNVESFFRNIFFLFVQNAHFFPSGRGAFYDYYKSDRLKC